jgi:tryptophan synthase alpha chain
MPRIDTIFESLRSQGRKALMPFICGGFPAAGTTAAALPALSKAGASIIEVGIPFSDPIADGPVISSAMHDAIARGCTPRQVFAEIASARHDCEAGIVAMISMSLVHRLSVTKSAPWSPAPFIAQCKEAGIDGLIVPDAPLEVSGPLAEAAKAAEISFSHLISPMTPPARIEALAQASTGFVYVLARVGITGEQQALPQIAPLVARVRQATKLPIAVGFGVSTAEQVRKVVEHADAAIVGSALVKRMREAHEQGGDVIAAASECVKNLSAGLTL